MAEITPTPRAGTWVRIDTGLDIPDQPRAGTWLRLHAGLGDDQPRAGTWLRVDSGLRLRGRRGFGMIRG